MTSEFYEDQLAPCPFCGMTKEQADEIESKSSSPLQNCWEWWRVKLHFTVRHVAHLECQNCGVEFRVANLDSERDAVDWWNERAEIKAEIMTELKSEIETMSRETLEAIAEDVYLSREHPENLAAKCKKTAQTALALTNELDRLKEASKRHVYNHVAHVQNALCYMEANDFTAPSRTDGDRLGVWPHVKEQLALAMEAFRGEGFDENKRLTEVSDELVKALVEIADGAGTNSRKRAIARAVLAKAEEMK